MPRGWPLGPHRSAVRRTMSSMTPRSSFSHEGCPCFSFSFEGCTHVHPSGGFPVNNRESTGPSSQRLAALRERGQAVLQTKRAARGGPCVCVHFRAIARDMPLSCKRPTAGGPGAIPTVDFLLHPLGAIVKKRGVKSHVRIPLRIIWRALQSLPDPKIGVKRKADQFRKVVP
jgi:hypothetical protein